MANHAHPHAGKGGGVTDWDAKILRSHIGDLQRQKADIERQIEWTIQNLRKNCPHEDTTQVTSLIPGIRCNVCGLFNTGKGWNE